MAQEQGIKCGNGALKLGCQHGKAPFLKTNSTVENNDGSQHQREKGYDCELSKSPLPDRPKRRFGRFGPRARQCIHLVQNQSATRPASNLASTQKSPETFIALGQSLGRTSGDFSRRGRRRRRSGAKLSASENTPCSLLSDMATLFAVAFRRTYRRI